MIPWVLVKYNFYMTTSSLSDMNSADQKHPAPTPWRPQVKPTQVWPIDLPSDSRSLLSENT